MSVVDGAVAGTYDATTGKIQITLDTTAVHSDVSEGGPGEYSRTTEHYEIVGTRAENGNIVNGTAKFEHTCVPTIKTALCPFPDGSTQSAQAVWTGSVPFELALIPLEEILVHVPDE